MRTYSGVVQRGTQRAAALGFPTLNIPLTGRDASGVYVARVLHGGAGYPAVAFADQDRRLLEAHVLDAVLELYGEEITIELLKKVREDVALDDDEQLRAAIASDTQKVRVYFDTI